MFSVELSVSSQKFIDSLDNNLKERIESRLKRLCEDPNPKDSKFIGRLDAEKIFRYRIGDFRALYSVDEEKKVVLIIKMDKRSRVYEGI